MAADFLQSTIIAPQIFVDQMLQLVIAIFIGMHFMLALLAFPSMTAMLNTLTIMATKDYRRSVSLSVLLATTGMPRLPQPLETRMSGRGMPG